MPSDQKTLDFLCEQLSRAGDITANKMFGEYGLYHNGKLFGSLNDNLFFVKPTIAGRALLAEVVEQPPYKGAKPQYLITEDLWENDDLLCELVRVTAAELPMPKPKVKKK